jgi:hypothetical protein
MTEVYNRKEKQIIRKGMDELQDTFESMYLDFQSEVESHIEFLVEEGLEQELTEENIKSVKEYMDENRVGYYFIDMGSIDLS